MKTIKLFLFLLVSLSTLHATAHAAGGTYLIHHDHSSIGKGGATLMTQLSSSSFQNGTFGGTNINSGTISGGTLGGSVMTVSARFSATRSCAAGHSRKTTDFCSITSVPSTLMTRDACTTVGRPVSTATALLVWTEADALAANGVAQRTSTITFYTDNTCGTALRAGASATGYEFNATTLAPAIAKDTVETWVPVDASGNIYLKQTDDAGNTGIGLYGATGYSE